MNVATTIGLATIFFKVLGEHWSVENPTTRYFSFLGLILENGTVLMYAYLQNTTKI